jgi:hypothetical protein
VKQEGTLVRIASGCSEEQQAAIKEEYAKLPDQFQVHFTPDYSKDPATGKNYYFYNKPFGILHFIHAIYGEEATSPEQVQEEGEVVVALLDPDFLFLSRLSDTIEEDHVIVSSAVTMEDVRGFGRVRNGKPVAQHYGIGGGWTKFKREYICGEGSPCLNMDGRAASKLLSVGPPYLATVHDWRNIAREWTLFVPKVYEEYPYLLAEMYAYSMSSAHHELPHLRLDQYMVSNVHAGGEGWPYIDEFTEMCSDDNIDPAANHPLPTFLHYCQFYRASTWAFQKRIVPKDIFSCSSPMFAVPPDTIQGATEKVKGVGEKTTKEKMSEREARRNAFMLCSLTKILNQVLRRYKDLMCEGQEVNYAETIRIRR